MARSNHVIHHRQKQLTYRKTICYTSQSSRPFNNTTAPQKKKFSYDMGYRVVSTNANRKQVLVDIDHSALRNL